MTRSTGSARGLALHRRQPWRPRDRLGKMALDLPKVAPWPLVHATRGAGEWPWTYEAIKVRLKIESDPVDENLGPMPR